MKREFPALFLRAYEFIRTLIMPNKREPNVSLNGSCMHGDLETGWTCALSVGSYSI
jgi:hypothetical protein